MGLPGDVTFFVQGETIKAHSPILCARSEVFEKELTAGLKESTSKDGWEAMGKEAAAMFDNVFFLFFRPLRYCRYQVDESKQRSI